MSATTIDIAPPTVVRPAGLPFLRLARVEAEKAVDTRAARWLLAATLALIVAATALPLGFPGEIEQTASGYVEAMSFAVLLLAPIVAILLVTTEWTRGTVLITFTQEPRRLRVLAAKGLVGVAVGALAGLIGIAASLGGLAAADVLLGRDVVWATDGAFGGLLMASVANMLVATAAAALLLNTAAALAAFYVLPAVVLGISSLALPASVSAYVDTSQAFDWILMGEVGAHWTPFLVSMGLWLVLPLCGGIWRVATRDVRG